MKRSALLWLCVFLLSQSLSAGVQNGAEDVPETGVIWEGTDPNMAFAQLAAYCGPILSFSPDEPLLEGKKGAEISIPQPFLFGSPSDTPVVYFRFKTILLKDGFPEGGYQENHESPGQSVLHLDKISAIDLEYFFYYEREVGMGRHPHDIEGVMFKLWVYHTERDGTSLYTISVQRVIAKAHALHWYDNSLDVDEFTVFPMTILVEEGKHASCTDKNRDGLYTPGYDVNRRVNDAWGLRDVISTGYLFTGGYEAWMSKVRHPDTAVLPPLPADSPLWTASYNRDVDIQNSAVYALRPYPDASRAADDEGLLKIMKLYGIDEWPEVLEDTDLTQLSRWMDEAEVFSSISIAYRYDGNNGISAALPLLIVKNVEEPLTGGWLTWRFYFKDQNFRDFGHMIHYTPSASRWVDGYFSAGYEIDYEYPDGIKQRTTNFIAESGVKFRFNLDFTPLKFLSKLGTNFWGIRAGLRYVGFSEIKRLGFVVEIGAGGW